MTRSTSTDRKLKTRNCVAYGLGDLYGGGAFLLVSTFTMYYLVAVVEMAREFRDRNKLTGFRMLFSMLAALLSGTVPQMIINAFPDQRSGHLVMGLVFGAFFAAPWLVTYFGTWDGQAPGQTTPGGPGKYHQQNAWFRFQLRLHIQEPQLPHAHCHVHLCLRDHGCVDGLAQVLYC